MSTSFFRVALSPLPPSPMPERRGDVRRGFGDGVSAVDMAMGEKTKNLDTALVIAIQ
jgi:hypothetical protein